MSQRNPASILLDVNGNLVGVIQDGTVYRLQVEAVLAGTSGTSADIETMGNREGLAVSHPEILEVLEKISSQLDIVLNQLAEITGEESPLF